MRFKSSQAMNTILPIRSCFGSRGFSSGSVGSGTEEGINSSPYAWLGSGPRIAVNIEHSHIRTSGIEITVQRSPLHARAFRDGSAERTQRPINPAATCQMVRGGSQETPGDWVVVPARARVSALLSPQTGVDEAGRRCGRASGHRRPLPGLRSPRSVVCDARDGGCQPPPPRLDGWRVRGGARDGA